LTEQNAGIGAHPSNFGGGTFRQYWDCRQPDVGSIEQEREHAPTAKT
jgi:hypothetical protein